MTLRALTRATALLLALSVVGAFVVGGSAGRSHQLHVAERGSSVRHALAVTEAAEAGGTASGADVTPPTTLPDVPVANTDAAVVPMSRLREADALVYLPATASSTLLKHVVNITHVAAAELVDTGTVQVLGAPAVTIGVDPGSFRNFTPKSTASSDQLWRYIAGGSLGSSYEMAKDRNLTLGSDVPIVANGGGPTTQRWMGAFLSLGLPGVDMVVDQTLSSSLRLAPRTGLVVSAPAADPDALAASLQRLVPKGYVTLMRVRVPIGGAVRNSNFLDVNQNLTMLKAALAEVGKPYVWGGTGPDGFDCSGLVKWSFAAAGITMPRTAAEQAVVGPVVPLNRLQAGDLLFWANDPNDPSFIDHVAIYLGNGLMVVAPHTGELVQISRVPTNNLVGAIRVAYLRSRR